MSEIVTVVAKNTTTQGGGTSVPHKIGGSTLVLHFARLKPCLQSIINIHDSPVNIYTKDNPVVRKFRIGQTQKTKSGGGTLFPHKTPHSARLNPCLQIGRREFIHAQCARLKSCLQHIVNVHFPKWKRFNMEKAMCKKCTLHYVVSSILEHTKIDYFAFKKPTIAKIASVQGDWTSVPHKIGGSTLVLHFARLKPCLQIGRREFIRAKYVRRSA